MLDRTVEREQIVVIGDEDVGAEADRLFEELVVLAVAAAPGSIVGKHWEEFSSYQQGIEKAVGYSCRNVTSKPRFGFE